MKTLISAVLLISLYSGPAFAQSVRVEAGFDQNFSALVSDMKCYEIIYKEHRKEYAAYAEIVRKKIIGALKRKYVKDYADGDVLLYFILNAKGSLERIDVDTGKSSNRTSLINITLSSLRDAAPFPPFPEELEVPELPFSITISFRKT